VSLAVFPEGTRSTTRAMGPFHGAAFRLAMQCSVPLVPVCLTGTEKTPPKGTLKLSPSHIKIHRMEPLTPEEFQGMTPFKLKNLVRGIIAEETARMEACA
jgi:1-acyl-sn-glycerol-3-phosphate acyltransferase